MKRRLLFLALLSSCGPVASSIEEPLQTADAGVVPVADAGPDPVVDAGLPPDAGQPALTGLPCDVKVIMEKHCTGCHGGQTYVPHLMSREDFLKPRLSGQLIGQFALERMDPNSQYPMPPYGYQTKPTAAEVGIIAAWVSGGMPAGACGDAAPK